MRGLNGKRGLITGGTSGLGAGMARRFAAEGAQLVLTGRNAARGTALAAELGATFVQADVRDDDSSAGTTSAAIAALGGLDFVVLNAGVIEEAPISATTDEVWDTIMETNVIAPFELAQHVLPHLRAAGGGSLVITASDAGVWGEREIGAYSVSKRAAVMLAQMLAMEAGPHGIRVNAVCPGDIEPGMRSSVSGRGEETVEGWYKAPIGRIGQAADIAGAVAFLCSDDSAFVSGTALLVDGGMRAAVNAWQVNT